MSKAIVILGSGKMARNIGLFLVRHGHRVTMVCSRGEHRDTSARFMGKNFKRLNELAEGFLHAPLVTSYQETNFPAPDIVIEATHEDLEVKRRCFGAIESRIGPNTLVVSSTSSILPDRIHPGCIGMHFFYPLDLIGFVEIIAGPSAMAQSTVGQLVSFAASLRLTYIIENESSAFCANRLLLPVQAEALRLVKQGYAAHEIDSCTANSLLPIGQLTLIDAVGIATVHQSVRNYLAGIPLNEREDYSILIEGLQSLIGKGDLDRKNKIGTLFVTLSADRDRPMNPDEHSGFAAALLYIFVNTCCMFLEREIIDRSSLDTILSMVYHAECTLADVLEREGRVRIADYCNEQFLLTGISYFKPSAFLTR